MWEYDKTDFIRFFLKQRTAALMVPPLPSRSWRGGKGEGGQTQLGASPTFYLARFAMALVPSSVTALGVGFGVLAPALVAPVPAVHAQTDTDFKVSWRTAERPHWNRLILGAGVKLTEHRLISPLPHHSCPRSREGQPQP